MWRILGTALFMIPIAIRCWLMKKAAWPSYKGYAVLHVVRIALVMGVGIAGLWRVTVVIPVVIVFLLALSFLVPVTRPKPNG